MVSVATILHCKAILGWVCLDINKLPSIHADERLPNSPISDMEEEKRKMYSNMRFTMEYKKDGDDWSYTVYMPNGMNKKFSYKLGEEFDSTTLDGRPIIVSQIFSLLSRLQFDDWVL